jgi:hypothetical protein
MTPRLSVRFAPHLPTRELEPGVWVVPSWPEAKTIFDDWKCRWWRHSAQLRHGLVFRSTVSRDAVPSSPDHGVTSPAAAAEPNEPDSGSGHFIAYAIATELPVSISPASQEVIS